MILSSTVAKVNLQRIVARQNFYTGVGFKSRSRLYWDMLPLHSRLEGLAAEAILQAALL